MHELKNCHLITQQSKAVNTLREIRMKIIIIINLNYKLNKFV